MKLHRITLTNPDKTARYCSTESPEHVLNTFRDCHLFFYHLKIDDHLRREIAVYWRRDMWWAGQHCMDCRPLWRSKVTGNFTNFRLCSSCHRGQYQAPQQRLRNK